MATTAKSNTNSRSTSARTSKPRQTTSTSSSRSDASQVREGVTKARKGAFSIVREGAERAVDVPVGVALTVRDRVEDAIEPWTTESTRERELKSLRTQVTRELSRFERRGGQARRKATRRARTTRTKAEGQLKKARTAVQERVPALP
jgi:hypothetical protein